MDALFLQGFTSILPLGLELCLLLLEGLDAASGSWLVNCLIEAESPHWGMNYWRRASPVVSMVCRGEGMNKMVSESEVGRCWQGDVKESWAGSG